MQKSSFLYPNLFYIKTQMMNAVVILLTVIILSACGGGGGGSNSSDASTTSLDLSSNPSEINSGQTTLITWQTQNIISCQADDGWTSDTNPNGSVTVGPLNNTSTFSLSCIAREGGSVTEAVTVTVRDSIPAPSLSLNASPSTIKANESSTISWSTRNVTSCTALNGWTSSTAARGSVLINSISNSTTYSMTCTGPGGAITRSTNVTVDTTTPTPAPTLTLTSDDSNVDANMPTTIRWSSSNAESCSAEGGWTNKTDPNGTQSITPNTSREYRMTCNGNGKSVTKSISITVNPVISSSIELTWSAPDKNQDGSSLTDLAGYVIYYGTSQNNMIQTVNINNPGLTSYLIDDLPAATYYFAITAKDNNNNESLQSNIASKVVR